MRNLRFYSIPRLGRCGVEGDDTAVTAILLGEEAVGEPEGEETAVMREAALQLTQYVQGERTEFAVPLRPAGTPFQKRVWAELQRIPWGEFRTYGQLAECLGMPGGARAVGGAVGRNPIPIMIPCHRILASGGQLGGFRLGSVWKKLLLELEGIAALTRK